MSHLLLPLYQMWRLVDWYVLWPEQAKNQIVLLQYLVHAHFYYIVSDSGLPPFLSWCV